MDKIREISSFLARAEAVLIGGGAGLSSAAGLDYSGEEFRREFADYIDRYGFTDLYASGFYDFPSKGEYWARWARHVDYAAIKPPAMPLYKELLHLVQGKDYFVITTNVDAQFEKAGFKLDRLFAVQGDYREIQCAKACHNKVYSNIELVKDILANTGNFTIPDSLVPRCPVCGGDMDMHLRKDEYFIEDENWHKAASRYERFLRQYAQAAILLLEIGVGFNTPSIIRFPFEETAYYNSESLLVRINKEAYPSRLPLGSRIINVTEPAEIFIRRLLMDKK